MAEAKKIKWQEHQLIQLTGGNITAYVNPDDGCNVCMFRYKEKQIIPFQRERFEAGRTYGIPILFPTPNRTRENTCFFEHQKIDAVMHGIVKNKPFSVKDIFANEQEAGVTGEFVITKESDCYVNYPYQCIFTVTIRVTEKGLQYDFEVENTGDKRMPFGIGLHPFLHMNMKEAVLSMDASFVMEKDEDFLPTGNLLRVKSTRYDVSDKRKIRSLKLDDVYLCRTNQIPALLADQEINVFITGSDMFTHMVVYTPQQEDFICVEPQTCSTDAINMYMRGFEEISGLTILEPMTKSTGNVSFIINEIT